MEFEDVAQSQALACQRSESEFSPYVELWQSLPSQREAISPFLDQSMRFIRAFRNGDGNEVDIEIAVNEALTNSVVHGNHEDASKIVPDPTAPENVLSSHGRGIYLIRTLMDEATFEQNGTVLKMRKRSNIGAGAERQSK